MRVWASFAVKTELADVLEQARHQTAERNKDFCTTGGGRSLS